MDSNIIWFNYSEIDSDVNNVMTFLRDLPGNFKEFVNPTNSNFRSQLFNYENYGITAMSFDKAFEDAFDEFELQYRMENRRLKLDEIQGTNYRSDKFVRDLKANGLYGESLHIKANILNMLWTKVVEKAIAVTQGIIDFANNEIIKPLRKFLTYLNSIFGSFIQVFPGLEGVKEVKEIMEAFLGIADD